LKGIVGRISVVHSPDLNDAALNLVAVAGAGPDPATMQDQQAAKRRLAEIVEAEQQFRDAMRKAKLKPTH
jgi:hypothetical protein